MSIIRRATTHDADALFIMARKFVAFAPYRDSLTVTDDELRAIITYFTDNATVFVADESGIAIGMLVAVIAPVWYAPSCKVATELAWWVEPEYRNRTTAIRLIQVFERWAKDEGAMMCSMSNLEINDGGRVLSMLDRMGYRLTEQSHTKRIV